jgi:hypothetical protein
MRYLLWLSQTGPATWARESESIWAYPTILFLHTLGLGVLVGFTTAIDFRILGFSSQLPLAPMARFFRLVWMGFWINALSGTALLVMAPSKLSNPTFAVKMACIGLGVVTMVWIKREVFASGRATASSGVAGTSTLAKVLAASSLVLWAGAITAGRLMAYIGNVNPR